MSQSLIKRERGLLLVLVLASCLGIAFLMRETSLFCNTKYGFGFLEPGPFLLLLEWGVLAGVAWTYTRMTRSRERIMMSILLGAGLANALERLWYGCVADYVTLPIIGSQVNVADILITIALSVLFFRQFNQPTSK